MGLFEQCVKVKLAHCPHGQATLDPVTSKWHMSGLFLNIVGHISNNVDPPLRTKFMAEGCFELQI